MAEFIYEKTDDGCTTAYSFIVSARKKCVFVEEFERKDGREVSTASGKVPVENARARVKRLLRQGYKRVQ